jgi:hypothetical protein
METGITYHKYVKGLVLQVRSFNQKIKNCYIVTRYHCLLVAENLRPALSLQRTTIRSIRKGLKTL